MSKTRKNSAKLIIAQKNAEIKNGNTTPTTFADLVRDYEVYAQNPNADPTAKPLLNLATAVTYSVLNKCADPQRKTAVNRETVSNSGQNPALLKVKRELTKDVNYLNNFEYANKNAFDLQYDKEGNIKAVVSDKELFNALNKMCSERLGDGLDLRGEAIASILAETKKAKERNGGTLPTAFMETTYTIRELNRKVWIKNADTVGGWIDTETTPIQEAFKAVRRYIDNSGTVKTDPKSRDLYLEDIATDPESGIDETIYRKYGKCAGIAGEVTDFSGKVTAYTIDKQSADDLDLVVEKLNLTAKQSKIFQLCLDGNGNKAIARYLGITENAVKGARNEIKRKARALGLDPDKK